MALNLSNLPILAPLNAVLHDEKVVLVALWLVSTVIATTAPALAPWIGVIIPALVVIYGGLILHQGAEDIIAAFKADAPASITDAINEIEKDVTKDVLGTPPATGNAPAASVSLNVPPAAVG